MSAHRARAAVRLRLLMALYILAVLLHVFWGMVCTGGGHGLLLWPWLPLALLLALFYPRKAGAIFSSGLSVVAIIAAVFSAHAGDLLFLLLHREQLIYLVAYSAYPILQLLRRSPAVDAPESSS